jgi:Tripartite tricarboxylate transporter TctA family.
MDPFTILLIVLLSVISALIYIFIGILPGTDETATMAPIVLILLMMGVDPLLVLAWFIASIAAFKIADSIPVALAGIPGGVMAVPQVPDALTAREHGLADTILRKGITASVIGQFVAIMVSLTVSYYLLPFGEWLRTVDMVAGVQVPRWFWILFIGLLVLAISSTNKLLALLTIPGLALLIQGLRMIYAKSVFVSLFLGITIGPVIFELMSLLHRGLRKSYERSGFKELTLLKVKEIPLNPLKILDKEEVGHSTLWSAITSVLAMVMSPVGLTILIGDLLKSSKRDVVRASVLAYTVRDSIKNATYVGGTLIPLLVVGHPTGPMSAGPAMPFFQKLEVLGMSARDYIMTNYSYATIVFTILLSTIIAVLVVYPILVKWSRKLTLLVFRKVPAEALYGLFISIVILLAYHDAGVRGIFGALLLALLSGALWKLGVSLGVMFMTLVAAPTLVALMMI